MSTMADLVTSDNKGNKKQNVCEVLEFNSLNIGNVHVIFSTLMVTN